jgi:hypothetical protein
MERHRPSRDMPAPRLIRLTAVMRPLAGARPLRTCATSGSDPTLRPTQCCSATSRRLDFGATIMIP